MRIGLIDIDSHNFPNLALMKLSAFHKTQGDSVEWYSPLLSDHLDRVYCSKVFSFTPDYQYPIDADEIIKGGTGYSIKVENGREVYTEGNSLPYEVEHSFPDYSLYNETRAIGFLTRGCPRNCGFCIVGKKEGLCSKKVADLSEFWDGQKEIVLLDPNILACKDWEELFGQLIESRAVVDFNQGLDARFLTEEKCEKLNEIRIKQIHFAWDRYEDGEKILPKLEMFNQISKMRFHNKVVYVLTNYDTTLEQDLDRIYTLRDMGMFPYVMIYNKEQASRDIKRLSRWVNCRWIFMKCEKFEDYR